MAKIDSKNKTHPQFLEDNKGLPHIIELINLNKSFGNTHVIKDITFYIRNNEFITLLGPSGCGKSTTLRLIAGFETPDSGEIMFEGESLLEVPPYKRRVNTVFQRYALFPHLNVFDNIAFGLRLKKMDKQDIKTKVLQALKTVDLEGYDDRWVDQLSGGQMQRVAIARAIVNEPEVLLLDEPLGALDLKKRKEMQIELKDMQRRLGITFIYVTHDQEEALTMSDTIVVMKEGVIQQIGTPTDIYNEPVNAFVADFIGESNIIPGHMKKDFEVSFSSKTFQCVDRMFTSKDSTNSNGNDRIIDNTIFSTKIETGATDTQTTIVTDVQTTIATDIQTTIATDTQTTIAIDVQTTIANGTQTINDTGIEVDVVIRPEDIVITKPSDKTINGIVTSVVFKGVHYEMLIESTYDNQAYEWMVHSTDRVNEGDMVGISFDSDEIHIMRKSKYSPDSNSNNTDIDSKSDSSKANNRFGLEVHDNEEFLEGSSK